MLASRRAPALALRAVPRGQRRGRRRDRGSCSRARIAAADALNAPTWGLRSRTLRDDEREASHSLRKDEPTPDSCIVEDTGREVVLPTAASDAVSASVRRFLVEAG